MKYLHLDWGSVGLQVIDFHVCCQFNVCSVCVGGVCVRKTKIVSFCLACELMISEVLHY